MRTSLLVGLLNLFASTDYTEGALETASKRLYDEVMANYSAYVRPVVNDGTTLMVDVTLIMTGLVQFDELAQSLWTAAWIKISWKDELILWNRSNFAGIEYISVPPNKIWTPDVTLANFHEEVKPLTATEIKADVRNDGQVSWTPGGVLKSKCGLDTTLIPFDTQSCELIFKVWSYDENKVRLNAFVKNKTIKMHGEWETLSLDCSPKNLMGNRSIIYELRLQRLPRYVLVNTVAPVIMLSIINVLVFKIPAAAGERLSFAITTLLSFAVFLSYMSSFLPRNGSQVCYLSVYILTLLTQSVTITISVIFSLHVRYNGGRVLKLIKLICQGRDRRRVKVQGIGNTEKMSDGIQHGSGAGTEKSDGKGNVGGDKLSDGREDYADKADRFFFYFYSFTFVTITIAFAIIFISSKQSSGTTENAASCLV